MNTDSIIFDDDFDDREFEERPSSVCPWNPANEVDAAEAVRRIAFFQKRIDELTAVKLDQIRQVDDWYADETKKVQASIDRYLLPLQSYAVKRVSTQRLKTLSYPAGSVSVRSGSQSVDVKDPKAVVAFAETHPEIASALVRTPPPVVPVPEPSKKAIQEAIKDGGPLKVRDGVIVDAKTGEIVDGVAIKISEPKVTITSAEGGA